MAWNIENIQNKLWEARNMLIKWVLLFFWMFSLKSNPHVMSDRRVILRIRVEWDDIYKHEANAQTRTHFLLWSSPLGQWRLLQSHHASEEVLLHPPESFPGPCFPGRPIEDGKTHISCASLVRNIPFGVSLRQGLRKDVREMETKVEIITKQYRK